MRLIDADELTNRLINFLIQETPIDENDKEKKLISDTILECMGAIEEQPTAYDMAAVLNQIDIASRNSGRRSGRIDTDLVKKIIERGGAE